MRPNVPTTGAEENLARRVEDLERELGEAHRREAATSEILRVIGSSPTSMRTALDMMAEIAAGLCDAFDATIHQVDADLLHLVAHHGPILTGPTMPKVRGSLSDVPFSSGARVRLPI